MSLKNLPCRESGGPPPAIRPERQKTPYFINLEQGVISDRRFAQSISMVRCYGPATGKGSLLPEYKRPHAIEVRDESGEVACTYTLFRCRVTEYQAVPDPDAGSIEIAVEHLRPGFDAGKRDPPDDS